MQVLDYIRRAVLHIPQHNKKLSEENAGRIKKEIMSFFKQILWIALTLFAENTLYLCGATDPVSSFAICTIASALV